MKIWISVVLLAATVVAGNIAKVEWAEFNPLLTRLHSDPQGRINGGQPAEPGQFPYQVTINAGQFCGGTLSNDEWVFTAAQCVDNSYRVSVYLGAYDRSKLTEEGRLELSVTMNDVYIHEGWSRYTLKNDIALIKLPEPIEFSDYIQPLPLPKAPYQTYEGEKGTISGWGFAGTFPHLLQWAEVPILNTILCSLLHLGIDHDSQICINTAVATSVCSGESGGPLSIMENGSHTLIGITSFTSKIGGKVFCELGYPTVSTRITYFSDWINEIMDNN